MPTEEQIASALKSAINTQLASYGAANTVKALDYDEAVGVDLEHVQVSLSRRYTSVSRGGRQAQEPWRFTTRPVANTVTNARTMTTRVEMALQGVIFTVAGASSTPVWFETADELDPDDGKYDRLTTWTFVL